RCSGLYRRCSSVLRPSSDSSHTSPPLPPSPPEGPPRGTNFSRRNAVTPFPPSPPFTTILARSKNCILPDCGFRISDCGLKDQIRNPQSAIHNLLFRWVDADKLALASLFFVLDCPGHECKQRVVRAP